MSETAQRRMFDQFFTTKTAGTGLGLAIVQQIVLEAYKGKLSVNSLLEQGSALVVNLPGRAQAL